MSDQHTDTFRQLMQVTCAHRILPERLKVYANIAAAEVDWLGLVERCERGLPIEERAAVALVAHLLGYGEALRVAPAPTVLELLELVDHATRVEFMAGVQMAIVGIEL